jgi:hypothetical protein
MTAAVRTGEVTIHLVDEDVVLVPSARALRTLRQQYGGLNAVIQGMSQMRDDVMVDVIAAGTNAKPDQRKALPDAVYEQGLIDLLPKLTRFVMILGNGGKDPDESADDAAPEDNDPNA